MTLTGTEKQIRWAEEIKAELMAGLAAHRERIVAAKATDEDKAEGVRQLEAVQARIESETRAAWLIEHRPAGNVLGALTIIAKEAR